jgi:predicted lipoprotein
MRILAVASIWCALTVPAVAADFSVNLAGMIDDYIRPSADRFAATGSRLPQAVSAVCTDPTDSAKADFSEAFSDTVTSLARVSFVRFGPLADEDRLSRLAFLPDPRGTAQRQIRKVFATQDATVTDPASLSGKSVALQGLTALQLIAFDKTGEVALGTVDEKRAFICSYALAIAGNVAAITRDLADAWNDPSGYRAVLVSPDPAHGQIRTSQDAMETVFNALVTGLIIVRDQHIQPALGKGPKKMKLHRIPFSRSGNGIAYVRAELQGIGAALKAANLDPLLSDITAWIPDSLDYEFSNADKLLGAIQTPVRQTRDKGALTERLKTLMLTIDSLQETMADEMAGGLALSGGFNALDGD